MPKRSALDASLDGGGGAAAALALPKAKGKRKAADPTTIRSRGAAGLRWRLALSTLSSRPLSVTRIRADDDLAPGLSPAEASLLRLLSKLTSGSNIEIDSTGASLKYVPGVIVGGAVDHDCRASGRSVGWFVEALLAILPFAKRDSVVRLRGITADAVDPSPEFLAASALPLLERFGAAEDAGPDGLGIRVLRRGCAPGGDGLVELRVTAVRSLAPIDLLDCGQVKAVRGTAASCQASAAVARRAVDGARAPLETLLRDVWIAVDARRGRDAGGVAGYSILLTAETTSGCALSAEAVADSHDGAGGASGGAALPEDVGRRAAATLLSEVGHSGCVDSAMQPLCLALMTLTPEDVSRVRFGKLSSAAVAMLRLLKEVFGITFKLTADRETNTVLASCLGRGYANVSKANT